MELWTFDEHRIGLHAVLGAVWAPKGQQPIAVVQDRYEWLYLYAFFRPQTGQTGWYILPELSTRAFKLVLRDFAKTLQVGPAKTVLLQLDNAPWHTSQALRFPKDLLPIFQPPYSPELQPAERLWQLTDEPIRNRSFDSISQLQDVLSNRCVELQAQPQRIKALTLFDWWPRIG